MVKTQRDSSLMSSTFYKNKQPDLMGPPAEFNPECYSLRFIFSPAPLSQNGPRVPGLQAYRFKAGDSLFESSELQTNSKT